MVNFTFYLFAKSHFFDKLSIEINGITEVPEDNEEHKKKRPAPQKKKTSASSSAAVPKKVKPQSFIVDGVVLDSDNREVSRRTFSPPHDRAYFDGLSC